MNTQLIPVFAGELSGAPVQLVDARLLHRFLEVDTRFNDWVDRRIEEYGFTDGQDFYSILSKTKGRPTKDYHLSISMAKELGMIERNEKGRQIRHYFLEMEKIAKNQQQSTLPQSDYATLQSKYITLLEQEYNRLKAPKPLSFGTPRLWTPGEDRELIKARAQGLGWTAIGIPLQRTANSVKQRYNRLQVQGGAL